MELSDLLPKEYEEMQDTVNRVAEMKLEAQMKCDTEITRIFDEIHDKGGEVYAIRSSRDGLVCGETVGREILLDSILQSEKVSLYVHVPDHVTMQSPEIFIANGFVESVSDIPWLKDIAFQ